MVDEGSAETSFVAETGKIIAKGDVGVADPTNAAQDIQYTLTFRLEDSVPSAGYILINIPDTMHLHPSTTRSGGSCAKWTCSDV